MKNKKRVEVFNDGVNVIINPRNKENKIFALNLAQEQSDLFNYKMYYNPQNGYYVLNCVSVENAQKLLQDLS